MRVDTTNLDTLIHERCRLGATYNIAGITAAEEEVFATDRKLCRHFDLPGPNPASLERCCDKFVQRQGKRIWRGKCASDPKLIVHLIQKRAPSAKRVVFETGPLAVWFYHALGAEGLPAICIDAGHAEAALNRAANKTDANDANGLAHLGDVAFFREVRVQGFDSMLTRALVSAAPGLSRPNSQTSTGVS